ncbi:MAG: hypothetical protein K2O34_05690 [Acetatifactor sp.]|nr:hypothetical protein [Acetatifactor sp.]
MTMFPIFEQEKTASIVMLACMTCSILIRVGLGLMYLHLIHEADNMASTRSRQLKQCKLKFANCYQLNHGMPNVPVFVDKFISRMNLGPLSPHMLENLSGQLMLLSVVSAGIGVCRRIIAGSTLGQILPFYIFSLLGLYLYFSVSAIVDLKGKRRILKINLVDYLENHLSSRMEVTKEDMQMLYGTEEPRRKKRRGNSGRTVRTGVDVIPLGNRGTDSTRSFREQEQEPEPVQRAAGGEPVQEFTSAHEQELEQLLQEFLTS